MPLFFSAAARRRPRSQPAPPSRRKRKEGYRKCEQTTEFHTVAERLCLVVEAVPARICRQCGAAYTDRPTTEALMRLVQQIRHSLPAGGRATLIYDFPTVEQPAKIA